MKKVLILDDCSVGKSDLLFVVNMFYHLSNSISLEDAYRLASKIDSETALYKIYFK